MARDEKEFGPDVEVFRPERFLEAERRDPILFTFGFGRRYAHFFTDHYPC